MHEADYSLQQLTLFGDLENEQEARDILSGKMHRAHYTRTEGVTFKPPYKKQRARTFRCLDLAGPAQEWYETDGPVSVGECWILNFSESPTPPPNLPYRRFACKGILNRAEKRGRTIPETLAIYPL